MARNNGDRTGLVGILFLWVCSTGTHYVFFGSTLELVQLMFVVGSTMCFDTVGGGDLGVCWWMGADIF